MPPVALPKPRSERKSRRLTDRHRSQDHRIFAARGPFLARRSVCGRNSVPRGNGTRFPQGDAVVSVLACRDSVLPVDPFPGLKAARIWRYCRSDDQLAETSHADQSWCTSRDRTPSRRTPFPLTSPSSSYESGTAANIRPKTARLDGSRWSMMRDLTLLRCAG
jgi:hypothetical protein